MSQIVWRLIDWCEHRLRIVFQHFDYSLVVPIWGLFTLSAMRCDAMAIVIVLYIKYPCLFMRIRAHLHEASVSTSTLQ